MRIRGDDRAVTVQVGAVLLFGMLVVSLSVYQLTAVPAETEQIEFNHNLRLQQDMQEVRDSVLRGAATDTTQSETVELGTRYPARVFAVNPPPATGSLRTVGTGDPAVAVVLTNASSPTSEVSDHWNGTDQSFGTGALVYEPGYNEYRNAPATVLENTVVYNAFENASGSGVETLAVSEQAVVDGRRITLVLVNGSLSRTQTGSVGVDPTPVSASANRITLRNDTAPMTLSLPTRMENETWQDLLADAGAVAFESYTTTPGPFNTVNLTLKRGVTYHLAVAKVGFGTVRDPTPAAAYLVPGQNTPPTFSNNSTATLRYEVRDRFNNPVSNETVTLTVTDGDSGKTLTSQTAVSGADGVASFEWDVNVSNKLVQVNASVDGGATPATRVRSENRTVYAEGGAGGTDEINPAETGDVRLMSEFYDSSAKETVLNLNNTAAESRNVTAVRVNFYAESGGGSATDTDLWDRTTSPARNVTRIEVGGPYVDLTGAEKIELQGNDTVNQIGFRFFDATDKKVGVSPGEWFVVTVLYDSGEEDTYFVAPRS